LAITGHELVKRIDALHVMHYAESKVMGDVVSAVHPAGDGVHEVLDLSCAALSTSSKVLAGKFSDPNVPAERVVEILAVADESLRIGTVPMEGDGINGTARAIIDKVFQPSLAIWARGDRWRNKAIALTLEGLKVLLPEGSSITRIKIRLATDIRFVEAQSPTSVTRLDEVLEITNLLRTPEHGSELQAKGVRSCGLPRTPRVDGRNFGGHKVLEVTIVTVSPSKTDLATTTVGRRWRRCSLSGGWGGFLGRHRFCGGSGGLGRGL